MKTPKASKRTRQQRVRIALEEALARKVQLTHRAHPAMQRNHSPSHQCSGSTSDSRCTCHASQGLAPCHTLCSLARTHCLGGCRRREIRRPYHSTSAPTQLFTLPRLFGFYPSTPSAKLLARGCRAVIETPCAADVSKGRPAESSFLGALPSPPEQRRPTSPQVQKQNISKLC